MGGPPFFCALFFVRWLRRWSGAGVLRIAFFTTKRFACWAQNCFWVLREGVAVLRVAVCCGGNASGRVVVLAWFYVAQFHAGWSMCPLVIAGKRQKAESRG